MMFNLFKSKKKPLLNRPVYTIVPFNRGSENKLRIIEKDQDYSLYYDTRHFITDNELLLKTILISNSDFKGVNLAFTLFQYEGDSAYYITATEDKVQFCVNMLDELFGGIPQHIYCKVN